MVSHVPNPTNTFQTILQPELKHPPLIKRFVPLPNIVQIALIAPPPPLPVQPRRPEPRVVVPIFPLAPEKPLEAPRLEVPTSAPVNLPVMPAAKPPEKHVEAPTQASLTSLPPTEGKDARTLLVLSPLPAPVEEWVKVPVGEARGRFAISPEPSQAGEKVQSGAKPEDVSSSAMGIAQGADAAGALAGSLAAPGDAPGPPARAGGEGAAGAGSSPASSGSGGAASNGEASGLGGGAPASGNGHGLAPAAGQGTGTGSGAGTGNGGGAFPGISIQGGSLRGGGTGAKPMVRQAAPAPPQESYSLTIVSTSGSGGGLADFGVFRSERVYTVYLDMRQTVEDPAPTWTLQYAVLRAAEAAAGASGSPITIQQGPSANGGGQGLVPPFPLVKEQPHLPLELLQKYEHRLIVVYAIINKQGKFEQVAVKQSPNAQLNGPLLEALDKWVFRPAEFNGETVSVKALLGIPIALPQ